MGSKAMLCNGCGKFSPPEGETAGAFGKMVDCQDGDGFLWTCSDCVPLATPRGLTPIYRETPDWVTAE